jgi:hypothetical protein
MLILIKAITRACMFVSGKVEKAAAARARYSVLREPAGGPGSAEVIVLKDYESGVDCAVAPSRGGALTSFRVRHRGLPAELLYRSGDYKNAEDLHAKAAFLCPVAGQEPNGGAPAMAWHDVANDLPWKEGWHGVDTQGASLILELHDSERTRSRHPFGFVLRAAYELGKGRLTITYTVSAAPGNRGPMPFCVGHRLAFKLPFVARTEPGAMLFQTSGLGTPFGVRSPLGDFEAVEALPVSAPEGVSSANLIDPQGISVRVSQYTAGAPGPSQARYSILGGPRLGYLRPEPWYGNPEWKGSVVMLGPGQDFHWMLELKPEVALLLPDVNSSAEERRSGDLS